ncbi:MAG: calcium-binding protein, partial [Caulobacteraceae bacterium]|nr:calcium-binding protein [Caulobacteraceae bacterium]
MSDLEASRAQLSQSPFAQTGYVYVEFQNGKNVGGTFCIVGRNDILSASHVFLDEQGLPPKAAYFYLAADYNSVTNRLEYFPNPIYTYTASTGSLLNFSEIHKDSDNSTLTISETKYDVALIGLNSAIGDRYGYLQIDPFAKPDNCLSIGYPAGSTGMMYRYVNATEYTKSFYELLFNSTAPTSFSAPSALHPGDSGGPLLSGNSVIGVASSDNSSASYWAGFCFTFSKIATEIARNDSLIGGAGADYTYQYQSLNSDESSSVTTFDVKELLRLGAGNDRVDSSSADDTVYGGTGNDTIDGGAGRDVLYGEDGDDAFSYFSLDEERSILGGLIVGNTLSDFIDGGFGRDTLRLGFSQASISRSLSWARMKSVEAIVLGTTPTSDWSIELNSDAFGSGVREIDLSADSDSAGIDTVNLSQANDPKAEFTITGSAGVDRIVVGAGIYNIKGGWGLDTVNLSGLKAAKFSYDSLSGYVVIDNPLGGLVRAKDVEFLQFDNGVLAVRDLVIVGYTFLNDKLIGGDESQVLRGLAGNDTLIGYGGNDTLDGGVGNDSMVGGLGDDAYYVDSTGDKVVESANQGTDTVVSDISLSLAKVANVENWVGTGAADISATGNTLGNALTGNAGANTIDGSLGNDTLAGGAGADRFAFSSKLGATNIDTITDFVSGVDKIQLSKSVFSKFKAGSVAEANFVSGAKALDSNDYLIFNGSQLLYDADGSGKGAAVVVANIVGTLVASDLVVA